MQLSGTYIVARDKLSTRQLKHALRVTLSLDSALIRIVSSLEELAEIEESVEAHVVHSTLGLDFQTLVEVFTSTPLPAEFGNQFAAAIDCDCLVDDGSVNPYTMNLVDRSGTIHAVSLEGGALDEHNRYVVAHPTL